MSIVSLLGKNNEIMSVKLLKISPYQFSEIDKSHQEYFNYISKRTRTNKRSIMQSLDLTKDKDLLNMKILKYRNSIIFYNIAKDREKYSYLDIDYWNYLIAFMINNRIFNKDFNSAFLNAVYLSKNNKELFKKYKSFYFKNLPKFSKENKLKLNQLWVN